MTYQRMSLFSVSNLQLHQEPALPLAPAPHSSHAGTSEHVNAARAAVLGYFGYMQGSVQTQPQSSFPPMQPADAVRYQSMFQQMDHDRDGYVQASCSIPVCHSPPPCPPPCPHLQLTHTVQDRSAFAMHTARLALDSAYASCHRQQSWAASLCSPQVLPCHVCQHILMLTIPH